MSPCHPALSSPSTSLFLPCLARTRLGLSHSNEAGETSTHETLLLFRVHELVLHTLPNRVAISTKNPELLSSRQEAAVRRRRALQSPGMASTASVTSATTTPAASVAADATQANGSSKTTMKSTTTSKTSDGGRKQSPSDNQRYVAQSV